MLFYNVSFICFSFRIKFTTPNNNMARTPGKAPGKTSGKKSGRTPAKTPGRTPGRTTSKAAGKTPWHKTAKER